MLELMEQLLQPLLGLAAVAYAALAVRIGRSDPQYANSAVSYLLLLFSGMLAGSALSYGAASADLYNVGRALSFISAGFVPVAFFCVYREYTSTLATKTVLTTLLIIPVITTAMALTNSMHELLWAVTETEAGLQTSLLTDHSWYNRVYGPFVYGLIGLSAIGLAGRLPSLASAHRKTVSLLLACGMLPFGVSIANVFFGMGAADFPFSSVTLALLWPGFAYMSVRGRVHEFSPLGYQMLFNNVRDPIFVVDKTQRIICANHAAEELLGHSEADMLGRKLWEDYPGAIDILEQAKSLDLTQTLRMNTNAVYEVSVNPLTGPYAQDLGMVVVCRDVTERREAAAKLEESEHLVRSLIETSSNGILRFSREGDDGEPTFRCAFANRAAQDFIREGGDPLVGMPLEKLDELLPERLLEHFSQASETTGQLAFEVAVDGEAGETWLRVVADPVGDDFSLTLIDVTNRKHSEQKMLADALKDPLTALLNRRGFDADGAAALSTTDTGAVLYLDLNDFKTINDRFGHQAGDALLKAFGHRLEYCLRPDDVLGRLGGDEFAIVMPGVTPEDVKHVAQRLVKTASEPYIIQTQEIKCTASVGIALVPKHGNDLWQLLSVADKAMYDAKALSEDDAANDCAAYVESATAS